MWPESVVVCFQLQSQYCRQAEKKHGKCLRDYEPLSPKYEAKVPIPTVRPSVSIPESLKRRIVDWRSVIRFRMMFSWLYFVSLNMEATTTGWMLRLCDTHSVTHPVPTGDSHWENGRGVNLTTHRCLVERLRMSRAIPPLSHTFSCLDVEYIYGFVGWGGSASKVDDVTA